MKIQDGRINLIKVRILKSCRRPVRRIRKIYAMLYSENQFFVILLRKLKLLNRYGLSRNIWGRWSRRCRSVFIWIGSILRRRRRRRWWGIGDLLHRVRSCWSIYRLIGLVVPGDGILVRLILRSIVHVSGVRHIFWRVLLLKSRIVLDLWRLLKCFILFGFSRLRLLTSPHN
jgi:hypothetical protein